jgi:hypothetical protein
MAFPHRMQITLCPFAEWRFWSRALSHTHRSSSTIAGEKTEFDATRRKSKTGRSWSCALRRCAARIKRNRQTVSMGGLQRVCWKSAVAWVCVVMSPGMESPEKLEMLPVRTRTLIQQKESRDDPNDIPTTRVHDRRIHPLPFQPELESILIRLHKKISRHFLPYHQHKERDHGGG